LPTPWGYRRTQGYYYRNSCKQWHAIALWLAASLIARDVSAEGGIIGAVSLG